MPYIFKEELGENEMAADVVERSDYDAVINERDTVIGERDSLTVELENAKTKFANAFLSSPEHAKQAHQDDVKNDGLIQSFDSLFAGRNRYNAN